MGILQWGLQLHYHSLSLLAAWSLLGRIPFPVLTLNCWSYIWLLSAIVPASPGSFETQFRRESMGRGPNWLLVLRLEEAFCLAPGPYTLFAICSLGWKNGSNICGYPYHVYSIVILTWEYVASWNCFTLLHLQIKSYTCILWYIYLFFSHHCAQSLNWLNDSTYLLLEKCVAKW